MASRGVCFFTPILGKREIALGPNTEVRECKNAKYKVGNREIANIYPVTQYRSSQSESRIITTQSSKAGKHRNYLFSRNSLFVWKKHSYLRKMTTSFSLFWSKRTCRNHAKSLNLCSSPWKHSNVFKLYQRSAQGWRGPGQMARKNVVLMGYNLFKETMPEISWKW